MQEIYGKEIKPEVLMTIIKDNDINLDIEKLEVRVRQYDDPAHLGDYTSEYEKKIIVDQRRMTAARFEEFEDNLVTLLDDTLSKVLHQREIENFNKKYFEE
jgi:hypothetical protein